MLTIPTGLWPAHECSSLTGRQSRVPQRARQSISPGGSSNQRQRFAACRRDHRWANLQQYLTWI